MYEDQRLVLNCICFSLTWYQIFIYLSYHFVKYFPSINMPLVSGWTQTGAIDSLMWKADTNGTITELHQKLIRLPIIREHYTPCTTLTKFPMSGKPEVQLRLLFGLSLAAIDLSKMRFTNTRKVVWSKSKTGILFTKIIWVGIEFSIPLLLVYCCGLFISFFKFILILKKQTRNAG